MVRSRSVCTALATLALVLGLAACASPASNEAGPTPKDAQPRLLRVTMYTWALGTGRIVVDVESRKLQAVGFVIGIPDSLTQEQRNEIEEKRKQRGWPMVEASLSAPDIAALRDLVEKSGLKGFRPYATDISSREPALDECPPTIVLTWSDREEVHKLPLGGTVKPNLPLRPERCYKALDQICEKLLGLARAHVTPSTFSIIAMDSAAYKQYEQDRKRQLDKKH